MSVEETSSLVKKADDGDIYSMLCLAEAYIRESRQNGGSVILDLTQP